MKRSLGIFVFVLLFSQAARADDGGGQPLICASPNDTFFPRGDHWAHGFDIAVPIVFDSNGPTNQGRSAVVNPGAAAAIAAVQSAFAVWQSASCTGGTHPDITFSAANANVAAAVDGVNTVSWVPNWTIDATTVAATLNTYESDTGLSVDADIQFNNQDFNWRVSGTGGSGCSAASDGNCYDIETVSIHEIGHFLGLNHVACTNAVMFPSSSYVAVNAQLSANEVNGVCSLYPPRTGGTGSSFGELCTTTADCSPSTLTCLKPAAGTADGTNGWCSKSCVKSSDCPVAFICEAVNSQGPMCVPGVHLNNIPVEDVIGNDDLCQPCTEGRFCTSNLCVTAADGNGICAQTCATDGSYACPDNFACITTGNSTNVCYPVDNNVCPDTYPGVRLNDVCYFPATATDTNTLYVPCEAGLNCVLFSSGIGGCLPYCDATTAGATCPGGSECCYGFDANNNCTNSSTTTPTGGCVILQETGADCTKPDASVCTPGDLCTYVTDPTTAKCFALCNGDGSCTNPGEKCGNFLNSTTGITTSICCDSTYYNGDPNTCHPKTGVCKRGVDVSCQQNGDCAQGLCQSYNNESFCTIPCTLNSDCPGAADDVNADGSPDGGATCVLIGSSKVCVPTKGPATAPACATAGTADSGGGCGCNGAGPADFMGLVALLGLLRGLRRRVR